VFVGTISFQYSEKHNMLRLRILNFQYAWKLIDNHCLLSILTKRQCYFIE